TGLIRDPAGRPSPSQGGCTDVLLSQMRIAVGTCATSTHTCSEVLRLLLRQVTTAKSPMSRLSPLLSAGTGLNGAHGAARPTARTGPHARRRARGRTPDGAHGAARPTARTGPHARRRARGRTPGGAHGARVAFRLPGPLVARGAVCAVPAGLLAALHTAAHETACALVVGVQ